MPLKILVVDDATFVRDMIKRAVRQLVPDLELLEAPDGARAISIIKSKNPDLILSDWEMPQMSGDELLGWVRKNPPSQKTPFVMITSRGDRDHVVAAVNAGVSDYLSKPFTAEELTNKISKQLKRMGYQAPKKQAAANSAGGALSSLDALTGGNKGAASPASKAKPPKSSKAAAFAGTAQLRFAEGACPVEIKDLSLQAMNALMQRIDTLPRVFDQAAVDLIDPNGEVLARLNSYVHALSAAEPHANSASLRVIVRFVDKDPKKMEVLSKIIASA